MKTDRAQSSTLRRLFDRHGGYLTSRQIRSARLPLKPLQRLIDQGEAETVQRGVYHLSTFALPPHADLVEVQLRVPYARPALLTALDLHGLSTTRPPRLQFAIPANRTFPALAYPPVEVFWYPDEIYASGVMHWDQTPGFATYSAEKTIADLLRLEHRLGRDLYLEGLKNYLKRPERNLGALLDVARVNGVAKALRRDLEVLTYHANH